MATRYTLAYGLDIHPWQTRGTNRDPAFDRLLDREEADRTQPYGRALDLGCGTGGHTRRLQERGWEVMGVDNARNAVNAAARLGGENGRYVIGDVSHLVGCGVGHDFDLFLDVGCFHGLTEEARVGMGEGVTQLAAPSATLLMLASARQRNPLFARGASVDNVAAAFPAWSVLDATAADSTGMAPMMRRREPQWIRLRLR